MTDRQQSTPFHTLHHLCIVVHDIEKAMAFYERAGIGPWVDYPPLDQFTELKLPDERAFKALKIKVAHIGPIQLQLMEPREGDSPQKHFLKARGEGVFHVGFVVDDVDAAEAEGTARGLEVFMRGRRPNGSGFTYFDVADQAGGVALSIRKSPPGA